MSYDSATQTTVTDPVGMQEVMTFSTNLGVKNLISKVNQSDGKSVQQVFDTRNNLTCKKDEENRVTTYTYNGTNQKTGMTEGLTGNCTNPNNVPGVTRTTTYHYLSPTLDLPTFICQSSVNPGAAVCDANAAIATLRNTTHNTELVYGDTSHPNLPTQIIQRGYTPAGTAVTRTVTLGYNAGQMNLINGPRTDVNDVTTLEYYDCTTGGACGQLMRVTSALGHVTTYDLYDANGRLKQMTDPNGLRTSYNYDERGQVRFITQTPLTGPARITEYRYTTWGDVKEALLPDGMTFNYQYDAHYLRFIVDAAGNFVYNAYDLKGNRTQEYTYDPDGTLVRQMDTAYDLRNHLKTIDTAGSITQLVFDAVGNLTKEVDPNTYPNSTPATQHTPDALNRLVRTIDRIGGQTSYGYDVNDRPTTVTAPNNATTQYQYDDLGNLLKEISPDRGTTVYTYDSAGNLKTATDARGIQVSYTYDALNRVKLIDYPGTEEDVSFTYDGGAGCSFGIGRLCQTVDASGTRSFAYDAFGNLQGETWQEITQGGSLATAYTYDTGNRLASLTRPGGQDSVWGRDGLGRIDSLVTGSTILLSHRTYRADGLVTGGVYGNGISDAYDYDLQGRLIQFESIPPAGSIPADGDLNGDGLIDVGDLVIMVRIVHEIVTPTAEQAARGDVHPPGAPDGIIDLRDYLRLQRMILGLVP